MAETRHQEQGKGGVATPANELATHQLPERPDPMARILELYEEFVRTYPLKAKTLLRLCEALTEQYRPLGSERVLSTARAARFTKLTSGRIKQIARAGTCGESIDGHWRFSEQELRAYMQLPRPRGPGKKMEQDLE